MSLFLPTMKNAVTSLSRPILSVGSEPNRPARGGDDDLSPVAPHLEICRDATFRVNHEKGLKPTSTPQTQDVLSLLKRSVVGLAELVATAARFADGIELAKPSGGSEKFDRGDEPFCVIDGRRVSNDRF